LADIWSNSDFEFSLKVYAQDGAGHSSLQKGCCEKFALKLHSFSNKIPRGMGCPSSPLRRGPDGFEFWLQGTMLKVAPVSTSINICQFVSQKNQASISRQLHSCGSGMCGEGR
jgi:hypothetical protein